jgi:thiamine pyrophosphate-dependent acetolactate synthase large subunit-like protein
VKVYELVAAAFAAERVDVVFALMGDGNMGFLGALAEREGVRVVQVRHENMAVGMADGHARAGRSVGVASVTYGPGLSQIPTSLLVAGRHHSPVVVFAGEPPQSDRYSGSAHDMDQRALMEGAEAAYMLVQSPASAARDVASAFDRARAERRPVVLAAAIDVQYADVEVGRPPRREIDDQRAGASPAASAVEEAAHLLADARRPVVLAGVGAAGAVAELERLALRIGAVLVTTLGAKGLFAGNPWSLGLSGSFADAPTTAAFADADVVLAVGTALDPYVTRRGHMLDGARVIHVDRDPDGSIAGVRPPDVRLSGDARAGVVALGVALEARTDHLHQRHAPERYDFASQDMITFRCEPEPGTLDPRVLMSALGELMPEECLIVVGAGHYSAFPMLYLPARRTHRYHPVFDFGSIGQGLPVAVGAAFARPDVPVIVFEGDASLLMNVQELETIARERPRLLVFAMNDGALGAEYHRLGRMGIDPMLAAYERPRFADVARAFGLPAHTVDDAAQAAAVMDEFRSSGGPLLVDVRTSRRSIVPLYRPTP